MKYKSTKKDQRSRAEGPPNHPRNYSEALMQNTNYTYDHSGGSCASREQSQTCLSYAETKQSVRSKRVAARIGGGCLKALHHVIDEEPNLQEQADRLFDQSLIQTQERELHKNEIECIMNSKYTVPEFMMHIDGIPNRIQPEVMVDNQRFRDMIKKMTEICEDEPEVFFYHSDHLGSASWITERHGDAVQHLQYLPYGERYVDQRVSGYHERFTFTGKEKDSESGFYYFGARYYDPSLSGLFISIDPMSDKYPSLSPYAYCAWNPVKLVDPDGNEAIDNDDWYKNGKGEVRWFNSTDKTYTHEGEEYQRVGKTACMTNSSGEFVYGDQYGHTHESAPLKEVSITENLTDFERTMRNPQVQHPSECSRFLGTSRYGSSCGRNIICCHGRDRGCCQRCWQGYRKAEGQVPFRQAIFLKCFDNC